MPAHPVPGRVFLNPTSAAVAGTQIRGIFNDEIRFDPRRRTQSFGSGLQADAWTAVAAPPEGPAALIIPVRNVDTISMQLLLGLLSTGTALDSSGGQSLGTHRTARDFALVVRPKDTAQLCLYGPRWAQHPDNEGRITYSRGLFRYDGTELMLMPQRSLDGTKKAFMENTVANIDAHYELD